MQIAVRVLAVFALSGYALGRLGMHAWFFDLFSHFHLQYCVALLASAVVLSALRDLRFAVAAWLAAGWLLAPIARGVFDPDAHAHTNPSLAPTFRVVSLNAWYRNLDTRRVARYLQSSGADVILVQELDGERLRELAAALPTFHHLAFTEDMGRNGAAIFSRWPIEATHPLPLGPAQRHAQWALVNWRSVHVQVVAVHLPWPMGPTLTGVRNRELRALAKWLSTATGPAVAGGDFNISPWSPRFADAIALPGVRDAFADRPALRTWPAWFAALGIRIDHCLISPQWQVVQQTRGPNVGSDHLPIELALRLEAPAPTPRAPAAG